MSNSHKIKTEEFVCIDEIYYGGSEEILYLEDSLCDFSKHFSTGSFALTDILIYELNKYEKIIGTMGKYLLTREEYANTLRNYVDSMAYRQFGFLSVNAIASYLERFSNKRRIKFDINLRRDFFSEKQFLDFIVRGLENDHPIILQVGKKNQNDKVENFTVVTGLEKENLILSSKGSKIEVPISDVFKFGDRELGALFIQVVL